MEFVKESDKRAEAFPLFKNDSFVKALDEGEHYLIIVNLEGFLFSFPNFILIPLFKKGLRKKGYKGSISRGKVNPVLKKVLELVSRRNTKLPKQTA